MFFPKWDVFAKSLVNKKNLKKRDNWGAEIKAERNWTDESTGFDSQNYHNTANSLKICAFLTARSLKSNRTGPQVFETSCPTDTGSVESHWLCFRASQTSPVSEIVIWPIVE